MWRCMARQTRLRPAHIHGCLLSQPVGAGNPSGWTSATETTGWRPALSAEGQPIRKFEGRCRFLPNLDLFSLSAEFVERPFLLFSSRERGAGVALGPQCKGAMIDR